MAASAGYDKQRARICFAKKGSLVMVNEGRQVTTVDSFVARSGAWATIADKHCNDSQYQLPDSKCWFPVVSTSPKAVRTDIRILRRSGTDNLRDHGRIDRFDSRMCGFSITYRMDRDWLLLIGDEILLLGREVKTLRRIFDSFYRWRYIRPSGLKLIPSLDEVDEIITSVVHIRDAKSGDMVLRSHAGGIIDVALVRAKSCDGDKIKIFGDEVLQTPNNFVPPTKHNRAKFLRGLEKLAAPVAGYLPADSRIPTYPETPSDCIPGRPDIKVKLHSTNRSSRYVWLNFHMTNQSQRTIKWLSYQWARNTFVPKLEEPFAYQSGKRLMVYAVQANDFRYLYPGCSELISVCVGPEPGQGEIRVFIPAYFFCGLKDAYFMLATTAPPPLES